MIVFMLEIHFRMQSKPKTTLNDLWHKSSQNLV